MKSGLTRLSRIPLCRGRILAKQAKNFPNDSSSPARRIENVITFIKQGRIATVVIKHVVFEKQCL